jgi:hypothetical protein
LVGHLPAFHESVAVGGHGTLDCRSTAPAGTIAKNRAEQVFCQPACKLQVSLLRPAFDGHRRPDLAASDGSPGICLWKGSSPVTIAMFLIIIAVLLLSAGITSTILD